MAHPVSAQHYVQTYSTILRFGVRWALFAFHIQAQNRSQHVAPLNEELLRKQSEDSVNGECASKVRVRKKLKRKSHFFRGKSMKSIDLKGF